MANSSLTLEKTRVQAPSFDLIGDGPEEIVVRMLNKFHKNKKVTRLQAKEKSWRQELASAFVKEYTSVFDITKEQMKELVCGIKEKNIGFIENALFKKLKRRALPLIEASIISGAFFIYGVPGLILNFDATHLSSLAISMFLSAFLGWILPFIVIASLTSSFKEAPLKSIAYIRYRGRLKKKYGPDYFPYQELREELGITPSDTAEKE